MKTFLAHFDKKNISNLVQHYGLERRSPQMSKFDNYKIHL